MSLFLRQREPELREYMDDPHCDLGKLYATYRQFAQINWLVSGWRGLYRCYLRPRLAASEGPLRLLDIGCGGADIAMSLIRWAASDGYALEVVGLEPEERAIAYLRQLELPADLQICHATSHDLATAGERFDVVISNHLVHHLSPEELADMLADCEQLSRDLVLFNDLRRSSLGYALFAVFAPLLFHGSFIAPDGRRSLRRSFTVSELQDKVRPGWQVQRRRNFHLLLVREVDHA